MSSKIQTLFERAALLTCYPLTPIVNYSANKALCGAPHRLCQSLVNLTAAD